MTTTEKRSYPTFGAEVVQRPVRVVDLTREIFEGMPMWFGHQKTFINTNQTHEQFRKAYNTHLGFEAHNLLISEHAGTHTDAVFEYDPNGNLRAHENVHCRSERKFDAENRMVEEIHGAFKVENDYDEMGNRVRRRSSHGNIIEFDFDAKNQVVCIHINKEAPFQIKRDEDGLTAKEIVGGHLERDYEYDLDGQGQVVPLDEGRFPLTR